MERSRVVEIYCAAGKSFGTGYLVTGSTVLTAWHVVKAAAPGGYVEIRPLTVTAPGPSGPPAPPGPWFRAAVAWPASPGPSGSLDVALLAIEDPRWTVPKLTAVPWGRVVDDWPVAVVGLGFPDAAAVGGSPAGVVRDTLPLRGHIDPLAHAKSAARHVLVGLDGPLIPARASEPNAPSPWSGASGAAVFAVDGGVLLAVSTTDHHLALDARSLLATPVSALAEEPGFLAAAAAHGLTIEAVPVRGTSPDRRLRSLPAASQIAAPSGLSNIGLHMFVGRAAELHELDAAMRAGTFVVAQTIAGLGGIGKTTLATEYARRHAGDHLITWSLTADSRANAEAGLAALTRRLCPDQATGHPDAALAEWAMAWLQSHPGWLLLWDNVDDLPEVLPLLAGLTGGHHLITSRRAGGWHRIGVTEPLRLGEMKPDDALRLLTVLAGPAVDEDTAKQLCEQLGYLPLAVEQVGAYLAEAGVDAKAYLQLWRTAKSRALAKAPESLPADRILTGVWRITLAKLAGRPLAGHLLRVMAWLAPDGIPRQLLTPLTADPDELDSALRQLSAYSMVTLNPATGTIGLHRMVQAVARTPDPSDPHRRPEDVAAAQNSAIGLLAKLLPPPDTPAADAAAGWRTLLPHIDAFADHSDGQPVSADTITVMDRAIGFLRQQANPVAGIRIATCSLAGKLQHHGPDHPDTLSARHSLADAYESVGDLARAISLLEQTYEDRVRVLGGDHPDTLASRNDLAYTYASAGDLARATPLLEQTLEDRVRVLGSDHPDTLASRKNLGQAYESAGDLGRAVPLFQQTLADRIRVLGPDHPDTLASGNILAGAYTQAGDLERAIPLYEQTLEDFLRVLGEDHPDVLATRSDLASAYSAAGDLERAVLLYEQTLDAYLRVLGTVHPHTLIARNNLANAYHSAGESQQAIPLHEQNLDDRLRVLGPDHPDTLATRNNLAATYRQAGDLDRAVPLFEQTLADRLRVLGPENPETLASRNNLAAAYRHAGDLERAIPLYEQTLDDRIRVLGPDHPHALMSRNNLAAAYREAGDLERAILLFEQIVGDALRILGPDHPYTLRFQENLDIARDSNGSSGDDEGSGGDEAGAG
ncbi:MAG: tetratricopeptide repeat protein [Catenulispora sp.]